MTFKNIRPNPDDPPLTVERVMREARDFDKRMKAMADALSEPATEDMLHRRDLWQAEFERLLSSGMSRDDANAAMITRIDAGEMPSEVTT